jgi:hypothetical protein
MRFRILIISVCVSMLFLVFAQLQAQPGGGDPGGDPGENLGDPVISGIATLSGSADHSGIEVEVSRIAPAPLVQIFTTNASGHYFGTVPVGLYNITYQKNGYFSNFVLNVNCFETPTLPAQVLHARSTRIHVPAVFTLIQDAIDNANHGDTIILAPGVYQENIDMKGKRITLTSQFIFSRDTSYITSTIIDGKNEKTVIACDSYEDRQTIITGLTIRNGRAIGESPHNMGGGIRCNVSSPTLTHLVIENNYADYGGGGIYLHLSQSQISFVKITGNSARVDGGGMRITSSDVTVNNAIIANNSAGERGGGIACTHFNYVGTAEIINSTIVNNSVVATSGPNSQFSGGAGIKAYGHNLIVKNSIVASNRGDYGISYYNTSGSDVYPFISHSLFWENQSGNFYDCNPLCGPAITQNINGTPVDAFFNVFGNPNFKASTTNYSLQSISPAVDAGYNEFADVETDIYLSSRIQNNNQLNEARVNIGATEAVAGIKPVVSFDEAICVSELESAAITVSSAGQQFAWFRSATGEGFLGNSANELSLDTLTHSITLYIANADHQILSELTPVSINVYAVPDFSVEITPLNSLSYQFSASSTAHINNFAWTVSNTALTSDAESPVFEFFKTGSFEVCLQASNPACEVIQCETLELVITGLPEEIHTAFDIFPNPATEKVTIQSKQGEKFALELVNATGSKMDSRQNNSHHELDIAHLQHGIYFLVIKSDVLNANTLVYKIIKTK